MGLGTMALFRFVLLSGCVIVAGCGTSKTLEESTVRVAAASDLQSILPELVDAYRTETGAEVVMTFGASGQLAEQIKAGAPFDLFLAANTKYVGDLAGIGLVLPDSVASYAVGALVLAVHENAPDLKALKELTRDDVKKVAIANPDFAPYGAAAKQALRNAGLWDVLQPKIVLAETVRQTLQYVQSGNAEAGLVSKATARVPGLKLIEIDPELYDPIVQNLGIVQGTENLENAERFRTFLLGEKARGVFASHGFGPPVKGRP